jgi:hypothetical protein
VPAMLDVVRVKGGGRWSVCVGGGGGEEREREERRETSHFFVQKQRSREVIPRSTTYC